MIKLLKVIATIFVCIIALLALLIWGLFGAIPGLLKSAIEDQTGFSLAYEKFSINPFTAHIDIQNLKLTNPASFQTPDCASINRVDIAVDLFKTNAKKIHFKSVIFDLDNITQAVNSSGENNFKLLQEKLVSINEVKEEPTQTTNTAPSMDIAIDHLLIRAGTYVMVDETRTPPSVQTTRLYVNFERSNIASLDELKQEIAKAILPMVLRLAGGNTLSSALNLSSTTLSTGTSAVSAAAGTAATTLGEAQNAAKSAAGQIKNLLKSIK
jgi:uncharacterized protein involved in outer membrane biogenesis